MKVPYTNFPQQYEDQKSDLMQVVQTVLQKGDFILGSAVEQFEREFADLCDVPFAIGVGSGTDALIMALKSLDIGPGDEVITVPNSWISTTSSIALVGAIPVFVDVADDLNMDSNLITRAITPRTKAILPVHLTGRIANMDSINRVAEKHNLWVIEDAAQAVGARYRGKPAGSLGHVGCFSLHPLKNLNACGDAGIITCQDRELAEKFRMMRNHGLEDRDHVRFWGHCSRLDTLQAAILCSRLNNLDQIEQRRRETASYYNANLKNYVTVPLGSENEQHAYHTYIVQTPRRDELSAYLKERGISVKVHYPVPIHLQEAADYLGYQPGDFPTTERLCKEILTLPIHENLTESQKKHVVQSIINFFEKPLELCANPSYSERTLTTQS